MKQIILNLFMALHVTFEDMNENFILKICIMNVAIEAEIRKFRQHTLFYLEPHHTLYGKFGCINRICIHANNMCNFC